MKKIRGDKLIGVNKWKYHKKTPFVPTFISKSKNIIFFFLSFLCFLLQSQRTGGCDRVCNRGELVLVRGRRWQEKVVGW
jgi:hypothetical protein